MCTGAGRIAGDMRPAVSIRLEVIREFVATGNGSEVRIQRNRSGYDEVAHLRSSDGRSGRIVQSYGPGSDVGGIRSQG